MDAEAAVEAEGAAVEAGAVAEVEVVEWPDSRT